MGLEDIELAMDAEDEFGIVVPDGLLQRVRTVGEFYDAILPLVREAELRARPDLEAHLWSRVREIAAARTLNVPAESITRETRFVEDLGYG